MSLLKKSMEVAYLVTSIIGAILIASNIDANLIGYCLFFVSSCCGAYLAYHSNASRSLLMVNVIFGIINLFGIVRA
jgi:hypothetical protein